MIGDEDDIVTDYKTACKWNNARKEKMSTHNCWTCYYFGRCNPNKQCFLERENERRRKKKNESL